MRARLVAVASALLLASVATQAQAPAQADSKAEALSNAVRKGDAAAVKKLLDEGVDVNTKYRYNRTPISFAADRGHVEVVKVLLARGADVNVKDTFYGGTPFLRAVNPAMERTPQHTEVVRLMLEHGGIPDDALSDALEAATRAKLPDVIALLEKAGAKPKPKPKK